MFEITMQRPASADELFQALEDHAGEYKLLAGGTDLVVEARMGHNLGKCWVDVTDVPGMRGITREGDTLKIGATTTWTELYRHPLILEHLPGVAPCCFEVGSPQIRNIGTLGGNVANASPAGDSIPVLLIYDTVIVLRSRGGERRMPVEEFLTGVRKTKLEPGEVIWGFEVAVPAAHEARFLKLGPRESLAISKVNAAVRARKDGGVLKDVRVAIGSAGPLVFRAREAEAALEGRWPDQAALDAAGAAARERSSTITDLRSTAEYRTAMVEVLVKRGIGEIMGAFEV